MNNNNQTNGSNNSFKKKTQGLQDKVSRGIATHLGRKTNSIISNAARDKGKNHGAGGSSLRPVDRDVSKRMQLSKSISRDMNHAARQARRRNDPYKSAMIKSQAAGMGLKLGGVGGSMNLNDARMQEATKNSQIVNQFGQSMASDPAAPAGQGKHDEFETEAKSRLKNLPDTDTRGNIMLGGDTSGALGAGLTLRNFSEPAPSASNTFSDTMNPKDQGFINYLEMNGFSQDEASDDNWRKYQTEKGFYNSPPAFASGGKVGYAFGGEVAGNGNIPTQPNGDDTLATLKSGEVVLTKEQQAALGGDKAMAQAGVPGFGGNKPADNSPIPAFKAGGGVNLGGRPDFSPFGSAPVADPLSTYVNSGFNIGKGFNLPTSMGSPALGLPSAPALGYKNESVSGSDTPKEFPTLAVDAYSSPAQFDAYINTEVGGYNGVADVDPDAYDPTPKIRKRHEEYDQHLRKAQEYGFTDLSSYNVAKDRSDATVAEIKKNRKAGKTALGFDRGKNKDGSDRKEWEQLTADEILKAQKSSRDHAARNKKLSDSKKDPTYGMDARTKAYFEAPAKRNKAKQAERAARKKQSEAFKAELQRSLDIEDLKKTDPEKAMDYIEKYQSNEKVKAGLKESNRVKARNKRLGL
jgi:hypothetical protein